MNKAITVAFLITSMFLTGCAQPTVQPVDETTDLQTYQNEDLGFELEMPSYVSVDTVLNDGLNRFVEFKSEKENFSVRLNEMKGTPLDQYYYLDFQSSSSSTLGGKEALVYEAPNGYCDGPGCTDPFVAYVTKDGDDFYILSFNGDVELNDVEEAILGSFKFMK